MSESKRIAQVKYRCAVAFLLEAETLLANAAGTLSQLISATEQWQLVFKHYEMVRKLRREVDYSTARNEVDMDSDWKEAHPEPEAPRVSSIPEVPNKHMEVQSETDK